MNRYHELLAEREQLMDTRKKLESDYNLKDDFALVAELMEIMIPNLREAGQILIGPLVDKFLQKQSDNSHLIELPGSPRRKATRSLESILDLSAKRLLEWQSVFLRLGVVRDELAKMKKDG